MSDLALALLFGAAFGLGCWSLLTLTSRWAGQPLARRIAPYVRDLVAAADGERVTAFGHRSGADASAGAVLSEAAARVRDRIAAMLGGTESILRRLEQAGRTGGVQRFRGRQLAWGLCGILLGAVVLVVFAITGGLRPPVIALPFIAGLTAMVAYDAALTAAARRRAQRIHDELPTVLEFLGLCLAAGEGLFDSLRRVTSAGSGELVGELRTAVIDAGTGSNLADALAGVARRLHLAAVTRAIDQLIAAIERGAPLAMVLQAQAVDAREDAKRALIERAGKNEIGMLVPLVFLILPLSVLFAIFPASQLLQLGVG